MEKLSTLYETCLQTVCLFIRDGIWSKKVSSLHFLPKKIIEDLISTSLRFQQLNGFRAEDLKLLLTSGQIREFKLDFRSFLETALQLNIKLKQEFFQALKFLASASKNLETLNLLNHFYQESPQLSEALNALLKNSLNLEHLHNEVKFDLKSLRNCKRLQSIMLHFDPLQPWYDFLEEDQGSLKTLDSIETFMICGRYSIQPKEPEYIETLLRHCPSLTSLRYQESSKALANLYRTKFPSQVKLRICRWGESKNEWLGEQSHFDPDYIRDAVAYNPFVEELVFAVNSIQSICYLSLLKSLFLLEIWVYVKGDFSEVFGNVLKDIGAQLKYLLLWFRHPTDISSLLKNCPNLEALEINAESYTEFSESAVRLLNLKFLSSTGSNGNFISLFTDCQRLEALFLTHIDEEHFGKFLQRNSLSNLKTAYFEEWNMSSHTFKEFLLNASNFEKIQLAHIFGDQEMKSNLKNILPGINHNASIIGGLPTRKDDFFHKIKPCGFYSTKN